MATTRRQRLGIWIITGVMTIGTLGGFIAMMVAPGNEARDQAALEEQTKQYQAALEAHQQQVAAQTTELSSRYAPLFLPYASRVAAFDTAAVTELTTEDLVVGQGAEVTPESQVAMYYIGWNPKGEIFDQSINDQSLKAPFVVDGLAKAPVIEGWKKGLIGMKIGGVRELAIPAAQAYGESGKGEKIPANTPLKFVVMAIDKPAHIAEPEVPPLVKKEQERVRRQYGI